MMMAKFRIQIGRKSAVAALLLLALLLAVPLLAQEVSEVRVKAAFVYNFARFVEWPPDAFAAPDAPVIIGVVDDASFVRALEETVHGKLINNHGIRVKQISSDADLKSRMHIIYLPATCEQRTPSILASLAGTSVLTVGESDRFSRAGGIIRLFVQDARMRFEINPDSAERAHLKMSARLLSLARIVRGTSAGK